MATIEQNICTNLNTALLYISIAHGYSFDVGSNVFEWRDTDLNPNEVPGIIWRDYLNEIDEQGDESHILNFEIVVIASGNTSPATIRNMKQDILTAFYSLENKGVFNPKYVSGCYVRKIESQVEKGKHRVAGAKMDCFVKYTSGLGAI